MSMLPLFVNLKGKKVYIIGGGTVALRRIQHLQKSNASLIVISPEAEDEIQTMHSHQQLTWKKKEYEGEKLADASLIILAAGNKQVHDAVYENVSSTTFINDAMNAAWGNAAVPGTVQRGKLNIAVHTNGASPKLTKQITASLEKNFDHDYGEYVDFLYEARQWLKKTNFSAGKMQALLEEWLSEEYHAKEAQQKVLQMLKNQAQQ
ncbi:NAD(P)-binding protein [Alkalicoccus daliensis]|uniref:precorrin-2 dehydrogenase n=1 Tax=Alkalicoccus daliensis TaxID=745820 RepID=A0A1H0KPX7_9BACI|nr:NAD(P)-binding protein [Alkalicoccus daliensis]SDO57999.1 precorrin-2 dehydrogenase / sirohydrochlorin ferrochelatase [Alkalicoccus daliensis]